MTYIDTLAITGGGMCDIVIVGAIRILEEKNLMKNIDKFAGSSAGALISTLLNIGMSADEIENTVFSQGSKLVKDSFYKLPFNLLLNYGLYNGHNMVKYIGTLFANQGFDENITFLELYEQTKKVLVLTGTSLNVMDTFYFNYHTVPDMKVIDAVRISISIPLYFTSVEYIIDNTKHIFVDGGTLQNFPLYYFDIVDETGKYILNSKDLIKQKNLISNSIDINCSKTLGIMYLTPGETQDTDDFYQGFNVVNNIRDYFTALLNTFLNKIQQDNFRNPITGAKNNFFERTICIPMPFKVNPVNFDLPKEQKNLLIKAGEDTARKYFQS